MNRIFNTFKRSLFLIASAHFLVMLAESIRTKDPFVFSLFNVLGISKYFEFDTNILGIVLLVIIVLVFFVQEVDRKANE